MDRLGESAAGSVAPLPFTAELPITLGQFLKLAGLASTGGEAKQLVMSGLVRVNSEVERRRGRRLVAGDVVESKGITMEVVAQVPEGCRAGTRRQGPRRPESLGD